MSFNLPAAQYLMRTNASTNRGSFDNAFQTGQKTGGNLPITFSGAQVTNAGGNEGIYFGLDSQNSTTDFDASSNTKVVLTSVQFNAPNRIQVGTKAQRGVVARLTSGSGGNDYREYVIGGNDTPFASSQAGPVTICLDLSSTSNDSSGGSYDNSAVTGWGYGTFKFNLAGGSSNLSYFQRVFLLDTLRGEPNLPTFTGNANFDDAVGEVLGSDYTDKIGFWCSKSGSAIFLPVPFSIGDGSSTTNFDDNGATVISPSDNAQGQENFRLTDQSMRVYYTPSPVASNNSCNLSGSYSWGTSADWDFDVDAPHNISGNFTGMGDFTVGSGGVVNGNFNLSTGSSLISNGANIDDVNVSGNINILGNSVTDYSGVKAGSIDFDTAGTYTLTGCNVINITNSSSGNVTINNISSMLSTDNAGTGAGQVNIENSATLTVATNVTGADVVILAAGTQTVLGSVDAQAVTDFDYVYSTPQSVDIGVIKAGYVPLYIYGYTLAASSASLPINLITDRSYL